MFKQIVDAALEIDEHRSSSSVSITNADLSVENTFESTNNDDENLDDIVEQSNTCLMQLVNESKSIVFDNPVDFNVDLEIIQANQDSIQHSDNDQYAFDNGGRTFEELSIKLGSSEIPRFSCANHKCNIAVRKAIKQHDHLTSILKKLSSYAGRKSLET